MVDLVHSNSSLSDSQIPKTAGLAGLEGAEHSAPKGRRFGRLRRDSRSHLQNSENEANMFALRW